MSPKDPAQPHGTKSGASRQLRFVAYLRSFGLCARPAHNGPPAAVRVVARPTRDQDFAYVRSGHLKLIQFGAFAPVATIVAL